MSDGPSFKPDLLGSATVTILCRPIREVRVARPRVRRNRLGAHASGGGFDETARRGVTCEDPAPVRSRRPVGYNLDMRKLDPDVVARVWQDDPPTDIPGLAKLIGRSFVELHMQITALDGRVAALEADVRELKTDVREIRNHLNIDAELKNLRRVQEG